MHIEGGCPCGAITYEAEVNPESCSICHCTDCQTLSGTAFRTVVQAKKEHFHMKGTPKVYVKTAESGNKRAQAFCPECGTQLYATSATDPQIFGIRLGTVKQRAQFTPRRQIWCRSAQGWLSGLASIPRFDKAPG